MKRKITACFLMACIFMTMQAQVFLTINPDERGTEIGDRHYGIFFEEINHAGDGGLYAELIRNRSFEDNSDSPDYWTAGSNTSMKLITSNLLNDAQKEALEVKFSWLNGTITNSGFWGVNIVNGTTYKVSFYAKTSDYSGNLTVSLMNGTTEAGSATISLTKDGTWHKYTASITATASNAQGTFQIKANRWGTVDFDMVSLFPPTYKNRTNGCRIDLAQMLADMKPAFMRFPGGCYVEGDYVNNLQNRFEWKKTIGPIEERPGHNNAHWSYRVSDGFGFHEMLQLSEDIGAEPLFVVNVGLGHGWYQPYNDIGEYIQETLDAIEYANGDASTPYGAMRIANGHEDSFNLRLIEIGNENYNWSSDDNSDQSDHYAERYKQFYDAIKAKYPDITCIGNVQAWSTDDPTWRNSYPVDAIDEHYYRNPSWFVGKYDKYDTYDRTTSPKIYTGEYAVTSDFGTTGNLNAALGEAVFMEGMENNSDICIMGSYAPIFVNENDQCWQPDMIRFNSFEAYGTPSYYVQKLMSNYVGRENVKWVLDNNTKSENVNHVGLSTWSTAATFTNYKITLADGTVITPDFSGNSGWTSAGGTWKEAGGVLTQSDESMQGLQYSESLYNLGDTYTIDLDATKTSGAEGFLITFNYHDANNFCWWNLGGWGNATHGVEYCNNGSKTTLAAAAGTLTTGQTYHIRIVVAGTSVQCYLDGVMIHDLTLPAVSKVYVASNIDDTTNKLYVKLVNPDSETQSAHITLKGYHTTGGKLIQMTSSAGTDENTIDNQKNVVPTESEYNVSGSKFHVTVPAYSFNILVLDIDKGEVAETVPDDLYLGYLFAYFPSNDNENLFYAYSGDGFNYTPLNNGNMVLASDSVTIKKGIRDPHILRGQDGKTFYMVATDMKCADGWSSNRGIIMCKSTDLIHWTHSTVNFPTRFPDGWSSVTRVWAPETIWDPNYDNGDGTKGRYMVYFSLLTSDDGTCTYDKVYYCYANDDFTDLLDYPQYMYDRGSATIDADIIYDKRDGLYHMIYKNEGSGGIMHITANALTPQQGEQAGAQWGKPTGSVQQTSVAVEGGGMFRLIDSNDWVVMYDCYTSGYYQFCETADWVNYDMKAQTTTSGMFTPRHGVVLPITPKEYDALIKAFPADGLSPLPANVKVSNTAAVIGYLNGKAPASFDEQSADVNGDGTVDLKDIKVLNNIILCK